MTQPAPTFRVERYDHGWGGWRNDPEALHGATERAGRVEALRLSRHSNVTRYSVVHEQTGERVAVYLRGNRLKPEDWP